MTGAHHVYVNVFTGTIVHLHFDLTPDSPDDPLNTEILSREPSLVLESDMVALADRVRKVLASPEGAAGGPRA